MSREIQLASAAAEMAWQDAGLAEATIDPERFGVIGAAGLLYCDLEELRSAVQVVDQARGLRHRAAGRKLAMGEMYPLWMLKYLPNMPACHIGIRYDARGPNNTIAEGDVSSLLAVAEAADVIRRDQADVMIVGGTGSRINVTDLMWHAGRGLALRRRAPIRRRFAGRSMPKRSGMVYGEGAAEFVLESREHAERRGVRPLARVAGAASPLRTGGRIAAADGRRDSPGDSGGAGGGEARVVPHRPRQRPRQQHARRRSGRSPGDSRDAGRRAGHRAEELLRQPGPRQRRGRAGGEPGGAGARRRCRRRSTTKRPIRSAR